MSAELLKTLIIVITVSIAIFRVILNELDVRSSAQALAGKPSEDTVKAVAYTKAKHRFENANILIQMALVLCLLSFGWFGQFQQLIAANVQGQLWQDFVFLISLIGGLFVFGIPFSVYRTFVLEAKFGFNRTTVATFILDRVRGIIIGSIILVPLSLALLWIYQLIPTQIWWIAFVILSVVNLIMFAIGTTVILPLFNKLQELPEGELKTKILKLCQDQNYKLKRIFVMDGSKRSSKTNAFFSGIGKSKTIVLFDSLIEKHTVDEVVGVLGHEIGHDRLGHVKTIFLLNLIQSFFIFALFGWAVQEPALSQALGGNGVELELALIAFAMLFSPISFLLGILDNSISRRNEHGSDIFAAKAYGAKHIISALKRLGIDNLSNPKPHPMYVTVYYSHPPVAKRIAHVSQLVEMD
ncbi:MAG: hypothetical protein RLZZ556_395 [Actinomycetota bacterium]|jgi:STE24 endopeptidase